MFLLSKTAYLLFLPFTWIFVLLLWTFFSKSASQKKWTSRVAVILLIIFTNPILQNQAFLYWEIEATLFNAIPQGKYDVGIVLTGFSQSLEPNDRVHFLKGAGRLIHTIRLYKEQKIKKILVSGASQFNILGHQMGDEQILKNVFLNCGVPEHDLIVEPQSKNTYENAVNSRQILKQKFPEGKFLLITSAFHMRRAKACFKKQKIEFQTFTTDFYGDKNATKWLPSARVLMQWQILFKEWMGIIAYRLLGYI